MERLYLLLQGHWKKLAVVALVAVVMSVVMRKKNRNHSPAQAPEAVAVAELVNVPVGKSSQATQAKDASANIATLKAAVNLAKNQSFLTLVGLPRAARYLDVNTESFRDCAGPTLVGTLLKQMHKGTQFRLLRILLSLEPIDPSAKYPAAVTKTPTVGQLRGKSQMKLAIPEVREPTAVGLFLCTDEQRSGRCAGKVVNPIKTSEDFRKAYASKGNPPPELDDAIFYFKAIFLNGEQTQIQAAAPYGSSHAKVLNDMLEPDFGSRDARNLSRLVTKLNDETSSSPLGIDQNVVTMKIGYSDGLCWHR